MPLDRLDLDGTRALLLHVADGMVASRDLLTELDSAIGDGDHGIGMARGFEAVRRELETKPHDSVGRQLHGVGTALLMSIGGASGAIFGTLFRGGGAALQDARELDAEGLARLLGDGLAAVKARGGAKVGDKTMVDALEPAAERARALAAGPLAAALAGAAEEARLGMERTRDMLAAMGRARSLGERARGHPDPGAASMHLILKFMAEYAARQPGGQGA